MIQDSGLLVIKNLRCTLFTEDRAVRAVDGVDLTIRRGEVLGLVGETGCGKSMTALSILRLIPSPPGRIVGGEIHFRGQDLLKKSMVEMKRIRGKEISMVFQDPLSALNPVFKVGHLMAEPITLHQGLTKKAARNKAQEMLELVQISDPERVLDQYPHQLSGGMCQRVMVAMALSCHPSLLIADEPTTALDVTIQAQVLKILIDLIKMTGISCLFITHNLGVVAKICHRVAVMYAGRIVEVGNIDDIFEKPLHPYTTGLLGAIPVIGRRKTRLRVIEGTVPDSTADLRGCCFYPRCRVARDRCERESPEMLEIDRDHFVACFVRG
jgi:oligopeptide/dipeptide ABC transporter ATP-binding protein